MRISDWSSDVCSSDLAERIVGRDVQRRQLVVERAIAPVARQAADDRVDHLDAGAARRVEQPALVGDRLPGDMAVERMVLPPIGMAGIAPRLEPYPLQDRKSVV